MRLGVNVDHIATVRQARRTFEPSPVFAALLAQQAGADQITLHLREDRRHIQDRDLELIKELVSIPVNLEMAPTEEMRRIALKVKPDRVTLVPERREEITTEGGLDVVSMRGYLPEFIHPFREAGIEVSLFVDPEVGQVEVSREVGADAVELHTGLYANLWNDHRFAEAEEELRRIETAARIARDLGLRVYAGHGLTYHNVKGILRLSEVIEELNIGHSIVANAVIFGFERAVREMISLLKGG
ncbi:MAG TPA: pyridoxine 5'-phosphate synthase [Aquifex aeolicus]|uniref:Pyridoxine 5'-phosphate synthase n=1 Tax=Aquifex aeolicus TaxID=63363 RepID=A0A7C5QEK9_AQUAO|nr:pyridoxine 5'-phosphate synthase [Aquifex aeolicus]